MRQSEKTENYMQNIQLQTAVIFLLLTMKYTSATQLYAEYLRGLVSEIFKMILDVTMKDTSNICSLLNGGLGVN